MSLIVLVSYYAGRTCVYQNRHGETIPAPVQPHAKVQSMAQTVDLRNPRDAYLTYRTSVGVIPVDTTLPRPPQRPPTPLPLSEREPLRAELQDYRPLRSLHTRQPLESRRKQRPHPYHPSHIHNNFYRHESITLAPIRARGNNCLSEGGSDFGPSGETSGGSTCDGA